MPRKEIDPLIKTLQAFETASLEKAEFALQIATETVRRRKASAAATPVTPIKPKPAAPKKRALKKPVNTATPIAPAQPATQN